MVHGEDGVQGWWGGTETKPPLQHQQSPSEPSWWRAAPVLPQGQRPVLPLAQGEQREDVTEGSPTWLMASRQ